VEGDLEDVLIFRKRKISRLLATATDLYDGNRQSLSHELERQGEITMNGLAVQGLGHSSALVTELQRVYRDGVRSHEKLILESLARVLRANRFVPREREVKHFVDFVLDRTRPLAAQLDNKVDNHARNAGLGDLPGLKVLEEGLDPRVRGEVAVLVASLRKEGIDPWMQRPALQIVIGVMIAVLGALLLWFFGIS
jgi:hypothetical protein